MTDTHAEPNKVTIEIIPRDEQAHYLLPVERLVKITFFGPTIRSNGAEATYPKEDVIGWVTRWLESKQ